MLLLTDTYWPQFIVRICENNIIGSVSECMCFNSKLVCLFSWFSECEFF